MMSALHLIVRFKHNLLIVRSVRDLRFWATLPLYVDELTVGYSSPPGNGPASETALLQGGKPVQ